jgi:hypothetical protein
MDWAAKRKLTYLAIFLAVVSLIGVSLYLAFFKKPPSCFDGKQNQKEDGIDCGGQCSKLCSPLEFLPVVIWEQIFKVAPNAYSVVAYIENPNPTAESSNVPYTFKIYDSTNAMLSERSGTTYIPPGTNFAVFESNFIFASSTPARADFAFDAKDIVWTLAKKKPKIEISNLKTTNAPSPSVDVDLVNQTLNDIGKTNVTAIVYDANGNAFAASRTIVDRIGSRSSEHAVFTWPRPFEKQPARVEIIPVIQ